MEQRELTPEKKDKGFTLVELLIVIVILGILATVVVFAVAGVTNQAEENACKTTYKTMLTAVESARAGESIAEDADPLLADVQKYLTDDTILTADGADGTWAYAAGVLTPPAGSPADCGPVAADPGE
ncbi:MAG TPA: type II secretion system protein [Ilumatobacter sp.]|nr:type II secretion system protein [Ilumatobacter sp.]